VKAGDLVRYDQARYDDCMDRPGLVIKLYTRVSRGERQVILRRELADVLFSYGLVSDEVSKFEVIND
jgi:hypothetical protein